MRNPKTEILRNRPAKAETKMNFSNQIVMRLHKKPGFLGSMILMLPGVALVAPGIKELSSAGMDPMLYIISGKLFSERFDIVHAGFVLDRPTIGKWLFWFSVMSALALPYMAAVRWIIDRRNRAVYLAYSFFAAILCSVLLCVLLAPLGWLIQYIHSMGVAFGRVCGLIYGIAGALFIIGFFCWAVRPPAKENII